MQVLFETAWLAPGQIQSVDQISLEGEQLVDEAAFFRAATVAFFPRGNQRLEFSFTTHWVFASTLQAEIFYLTHIGSLPMTAADSGPLQCICGAENPATAQTVYAASAVLKKVQMLRQIGVSVDVRYTLDIPGFTSQQPANIPSYPNPNELVQVFRRGQIPLSIGQVLVAVVLSSPLPGQPGADPDVWITGPTGGYAIEPVCYHDSVTVNGFTAAFPAIPAQGYYLNYIVYM
jgi:hypothetical protein